MYREISFWKFALGLAVVSVPALLLEAQGEDEWAWRYVGLILIGLIVVNAGGIAAFMNFVRRELARR